MNLQGKCKKTTNICKILYQVFPICARKDWSMQKGIQDPVKVNSWLGWNQRGHFPFCTCLSFSYPLLSPVTRILIIPCFQVNNHHVSAWTDIFFPLYQHLTNMSKRKSKKELNLYSCYLTIYMLNFICVFFFSMLEKEMWGSCNEELFLWTHEQNCVGVLK